MCDVGLRFVFFTIKENNVITNKNWQVLEWTFFFSLKKKKKVSVPLTHAQWGRLTHTLMVLSFFTFCAGDATTPISCDGSSVPHTESGIRLLSTSDSLLCLCSGILTPACVTLPCALPSLILLQADCNFISHNGTFLNTPEGGGRRGAVTAHQHICSGQKRGEEAAATAADLQELHCFSMYRKPRCRAVVQRCYRSCITALVLCILCTLFIYLFIYIFLFFCLCTSVYILAVHFVTFYSM